MRNTLPSMQHPRRRTKGRSAPARIWAALVIAGFAATLGVTAMRDAIFPAPIAADVTLAATESQPGLNNEDDEAGFYDPPERHPVVINRPEGPPRLSLDMTGLLGRSMGINCSTCHTIRESNPDNRSTEQLDEFHQGLAYVHGDLTCLSCHNPQNYDTLRLADGRSLNYRDVMNLCAQCHGPQWRDYQHGAHGGMAGHWDLSKGPRMRNNCIDCHDPHAPKFPMMQPTFKPIDRFLTPAGSKVEEIHPDDGEIHE